MNPESTNGGSNTGGKSPSRNQDQIPRSGYVHFLRIPTRWMDNDIYGHVNNVVYYSFFDTVINQYLIAHGGLDIHSGTVIGLAVETQCRFLGPIAFPQIIEAGLLVRHIGRSSVRYEIGLFVDGEESPCAQGHFVHVFVDRLTRTPVPIPVLLRETLTNLSTQR